MKTLLQTLFFISVTFTVFGQSGQIVWSEEYKDRGYYSVLGESENAFFVERKYNTRTNNRDVDIELMRFDNNMEMTHVVQLKNLEKGSYASIATINTPEGLAHIYYQTSKSGEHYVSAQLFDHADLRKTEIVDLAQFKIYQRAEQLARQDGDFQINFPLDILLSRDKTKLAIYFDQEKAGKNKKSYYQYCVIDVSKGFQVLFQGDFFSDDQSNKYSISNRHLSNSGKLTYAIKKFVRNNSTEHINQKPAYDYEIHHMTGVENSEYIYDIKVRKDFIDRLVVGSDEMDNLYISGYIRKQPFGGILRSFMMSLDALGYERFTNKEVYSRRDVKQIEGRERKELDEDFQTIDVIPAKDIVYIVRQYRRQNRRTMNNNVGIGFNRFNNVNTIDNFEYYWRYDEVVVEGVGKETGEILWTAVNERRQEDDDYYSRYFITGQYELIDGDLFLLYNEREENLIRMRRKEDIKRVDIPGDKTTITVARITADGDLRLQALDDENEYHLPERGAFIGSNSLYLFNHHRNYRKFYVGKSDLSILDF